jgi:hypothetical protein
MVRGQPARVLLGRFRRTAGRGNVAGDFEFVGTQHSRSKIGVAAILLTPTATVMFGALLTRVANPFAWMDLFHLLYACCTILAFVCGVLGVIGGFTLLRGSVSGRGLLLAASFLSLSDLPVGIAIGVYTLIVLLRGPAIASATREQRQPAIRQDIS